MQKLHRSLTVLACLALALDLSAAELGLDFANGFDRAPNADSNYGWAFTVSSPITIDGLGLWDAGSDGLIEKHDVGLWLTSTPIPESVLITSTNVSNEGSTPIGSMSGGGRWLFSTVPAVTLQPGAYTIGALYRSGSPASNDAFVSDALTIITAPGVQYVGTRESHNTPNLVVPTFPGLNEHHGFFGPNFRVADVPEPTASCGLALASSLVLLRRRIAGKR